MTKEMLAEIIKDLRHKNKILIICLIVSILLLILTAAFAFSDFEFRYTETNDYTIDTTASADGTNAEMNQSVDLSNENNPTYIICGTVVVCMIILCVGVGLTYGKSTRSHQDNDSEKKDDSNN